MFYVDMRKGSFNNCVTVWNCKNFASVTCRYPYVNIEWTLTEIIIRGKISMYLRIKLFINRLKSQEIWSSIAQEYRITNDQSSDWLLYTGIITTNLVLGWGCDCMICCKGSIETIEYVSSQQSLLSAVTS